jgi:hypothetical protein
MKKFAEGGDLINKLNSKLINLDSVLRIQDEQILECSFRFKKPIYQLKETEKQKRVEKCTP